MFEVLCGLIRLNPRILCSVENPTAALRLHPSVVRLTSGTPPLFRIVEVDYCKTAQPEFDGGKVFTQKPTDFILYGVGPEGVFSLPRCNQDCRFRLPEHTGLSHLHSRAVHIDHRSPPGQTKQEGSMRHAIPCTLFHLLFEAHEEWLEQRVIPLVASNEVVDTRSNSTDASRPTAHDGGSFRRTWPFGCVLGLKLPLPGLN